MWKRLAAAALLMILGSASGSVLAAPAGSDPGPDVDARVYIFRGDLGIFFSTGMDYLAAELNQRGLTAGIYPWENWKSLADDAIAYYRAHPRARITAEAGIRVAASPFGLRTRKQTKLTAR